MTVTPRVTGGSVACMAASSSRISWRISDVSGGSLFSCGLVGVNWCRACCTSALGEQRACRAKSLRRMSSASLSQIVTALSPCWRFASRQRCTRVVSLITDAFSIDNSYVAVTSLLRLPAVLPLGDHPREQRLDPGQRGFDVGIDLDLLAVELGFLHLARAEPLHGRPHAPRDVPMHVPFGRQVPDGHYALNPVLRA